MKNATATIAAAQPPVAQPAGELVALNPETLIAKAIEANVPVESLERLLAMRAQLKQEQAREAFSRSLAGFQADIPPIKKCKTATVRSKTGANFSYKYADIAAIQRAIAPRLKECGLSVTFDTAQEADILKVACIVHHVKGHSERTEFPVPIDRAARMNDTQKVGSALTYGRRYALCAALGIVTGEEDDDGQAAGMNPPQPGAHPSQGVPTGSAPPARQNGAPNTATAPVQAPEQIINGPQHRLLEARIKELQLDRKRVKTWVAKATANRHGGPVEHLNQLPVPLFERLLKHLPEWAAAQPEAPSSGLAERTEAVALEEAGRWGWSGVMGELPDIAAKMKDSAKHRKDQAKYADRGSGEEIRRAEAVERTAGYLERIYAAHEANAERGAIQGEAATA